MEDQCQPAEHGLQEGHGEEYGFPRGNSGRQDTFHGDAAGLDPDYQVSISMFFVI